MKNFIRSRNSLYAFGVLAIATLAAIGTVHAQGAGAPEVLFNPLAATVDPNAPVQSLSALFINVLFGIAGSIALAMYVWAGALWLGSAGNPKMVDKGKAVVQWTTLGVIMMFSAYTLVSYIFSSFGTGAVGSTTGPGGTTPGPGTGTGGNSQYCCLDYGAKKASTVNSAAECSGSNKQSYEGSCDKLQFCLNADPNISSAQLNCAPVPANGSCGAGVASYSSFGNCLTNVKAGAGVGGSTPTSPYCCFNVNTKTLKASGYTNINATSDAEASDKCTKQKKDKYVLGECSKATIGTTIYKY